MAQRLEMVPCCVAEGLPCAVSFWGVNPGCIFARLRFDINKKQQGAACQQAIRDCPGLLLRGGLSTVDRGSSLRLGIQVHDALIVGTNAWLCARVEHQGARRWVQHQQVSTQRPASCWQQTLVLVSRCSGPL